MSYNTIGYLVFFAIMLYVIGVIGWQFYANGRFYLVSIFKSNPHLIDSINKFLLLGYYLFNLGYVAISVQYWETINTLNDLIGMIGERSGKIIITLGLMHYFNMLWLSQYYRIKNFLKSI